MSGFRLADQDGALRIGYGERELARYVYRPTEPQLESPRPYWHPVRTLAGDQVTRYRPADHVWHKGIAWSLPNVSSPDGTENFWGGTTYLRDRGYVQLPNNGAMVHRDFPHLVTTAQRVTVAEHLDWVTQSDCDVWFHEHRTFAASLAGDAAWLLGFQTRLANVSGAAVAIGSPTTQGRHNAGYGGLFWRGPESFTGGTVHTPHATGADDLMGARAPWLAYTGPGATLVFVDGPDNPDHPTHWFVRAHPFAGVCPAPFFRTETELPAGGTLTLQYAVVVAAGGDPGRDGAGRLAAAGRSFLEELA